MIGQKVRQYRILERLGAGGMGVVYKAEDTKLKRIVALKFLSPHAVESPEEKERLLNEARAVAALDHPNICTVYEVNEENDHIFIVMPYVRGASLKDKVQSGPLPLGEVLLIAIQIAKGLEAAHKVGIVHRDIKSSNVIVTDEQQVKILDFGLAEVVGPGKQTSTTEVMGTAAYMSPEQTRGDPVDHRTDIWSLGICLYEMLCGRLPFGGEYVQAIIYSILNEEPRPLSVYRPNAPSELERALRKALAKNPDARYQSISDFLVELRSLRRDLELGDLKPAPAEGARLPSIAVLPFANLSGDKEQEYFCHGITEDITNHLANVSGLRVASRTSSFAFKGKHEDVREIGRRLAVETLLEGSVQKAGQRLRITAQLVSVTDGYHLWSERYDRELKDVFRIQDEIALNIVQSLKGKLTEQDKRAIEKPTTHDLQAFDFYLRGRQYFYQSKRKSIDHARELFARAIERDPEYALAYAGMADCHSYLYMYFDHREENIRDAMAASEKALELDSDLAESHASRGFALSMGKRYEEAAEEFETAIRLNPRLFEAYYFYARTCFVQGKLEEAAKLFEQAEVVHPRGYLAPILLGQTYRTLNIYDKMVETYKRGLKNIEQHLEMNPDDSRAVYLASAAYIELGERQKGLEFAKRAYNMDPGDPYIVYGVACSLSRLGNVEEAVRYLEEAVDAGFAHKEWIQNDSDFDLIRDHPRYRALIQRLK